jgi:hypothetical protein
MHFPFPVTLALAALIPLILGAIWFNPKVFGKAWMSSIGQTEESLRSGSNMALTFVLAYVLSFFLAFALNFMVIHQFHVYSMLADRADALKDPISSLNIGVNEFMHSHLESFRTFRHGAFHGVLGGLTFALPVVGINALFEKKGLKYVAVNAGFWIVCCALMGAFICHFQTLDYNFIK